MARYTKKEHEAIKKAMAEYRDGELTTRSNGRINNRKQAKAHALSLARKNGTDTPPRRVYRD